MGKKASCFPDWVNRHRKPGTEIRRFGNRYYVYEAKGFYDRERKKSRKKTGGYLGTIDETAGFVEAKTKRVPRSYRSVDVNKLSTKEYGLSAFIRSFCSDITEPLKAYFPLQWEWLTVALYCRLLNASPLKNMGYYYRRSFLSEELNVSVTPAGIGQMLRDLGRNRIPAVEYMQHLSGCKKTDMLLIDATSYYLLFGKPVAGENRPWQTAHL
jgi:hypothetical protein